MNLKEIQQPVEQLLKDTNRLLKERVRSSIPVIDNITRMAPIAKGKKIRSTLLFLLAGMNDALSPMLPEIAASIEMFHLSSLIHDDIVDNSQLRRGVQTLNSNLGNNMSVLWGDFLFISSFNALNNLGKKGLLDIALEAARLMVEGQIIELANTFNFDVDKKTYYDIIDRKTSSLFSAVTQMTAVACDIDPGSMDDYHRFGIDFGSIFQVSDDMLDIFSERSGKDRFGDLKEGKITLPYILLLENCKDKNIRSYLDRKNEEKLLELFEEYKIKEKTMDEISQIHARAVAFLDRFPDSLYKRTLLKLLEFIKYRDY